VSCSLDDGHRGTAGKYPRRRSALLRKVQEIGRLAWYRRGDELFWRPWKWLTSKVQLRQTRPVVLVSLREKIHRYEEAEAMFDRRGRRR